jgi:hypothetical protein
LSSSVDTDEQVRLGTERRRFLKNKRYQNRERYRIKIKINKMAAQENVLPVGFQPIVGMLEMVAFKKRMIGPVGDAWVEAARSKFADVGVLSLHDFVRHVLMINRKLRNAGHTVLHQTTLNMMLREVCKMLFGPDEE